MAAQEQCVVLEKQWQPQFDSIRECSKFVYWCARIDESVDNNEN